METQTAEATQTPVKRGRKLGSKNLKKSAKQAMATALSALANITPPLDDNDPHQHASSGTGQTNTPAAPKRRTRKPNKAARQIQSSGATSNGIMIPDAGKAPIFFGQLSNVLARRSEYGVPQADLNSYLKVAISA